MNETELENICFNWFQGCGWDIVYDSDLAPGAKNRQQTSYSDVFFEQKLRAALVTINPHIPSDVIDEAYHKIDKPFKVRY